MIKRSRDGLFDGESFRGLRWFECKWNSGGFRHAVVRCSEEGAVIAQVLPQSVNDGEIRRIDHKQSAAWSLAGLVGA